MASGLDSPSTLTPDKDPVYARLHQKLFHETLRLAGDNNDFTPGPAATTRDSLPPAPIPTDARPGTPAPLTTATDSVPPAPIPVRTATDTTATARTATDGLPAPDSPTQLAATTPTDASAKPAPTTGNCTTFNYGDAGSSDQDPKICNWRPNPNSTSQLTKDWFAAHSQQASVPIDSAAYTVKFGDCLESIARRELKAENKTTGGTAIKDEVAKIVALNHDHYKSLNCNTEFIKDGWKLKLKDDCAAPTTTPTDVPPPAPKPVTTPDTSCHTDKPCPGDGPAHVEPTNKPAGDHPKKDCAPCTADVIITNPHHKTFVNGQQAGDHDVTIITGNTTKELPLPGHRRNGQANAALTDSQPPQPAATDVRPTTPAPVATDRQPTTPAPVDSTATVTTPPPDAPKTIKAPVVANTDATPLTTDDLTPGPTAAVPAEVPAPVKTAAAPVPRTPITTAATKPATSSTDVPGDGNDLGPGG